jgi:hypothetical protein
MLAFFPWRFRLLNGTAMVSLEYHSQRDKQIVFFRIGDRCRCGAEMRRVQVDTRSNGGSARSAAAGLKFSWKSEQKWPYTEVTRHQHPQWWKLPLHWSKKASKSVEFLSLSALASLIAFATVFALRCHLEQRQMVMLLDLSQHRQQACLELGWRWEADDQEHQYGGTSAGTSTTVGPISGFVMDVTENEFGHANGQCHAVNASYRDMLAGD